MACTTSDARRPDAARVSPPRRRALRACTNPWTRRRRVELRRDLLRTARTPARVRNSPCRSIFYGGGQERPRRKSVKSALFAELAIAFLYTKCRDSRKRLYYSAKNTYFFNLRFNEEEKTFNFYFIIIYLYKIYYSFYSSKRTILLVGIKLPIFYCKFSALYSISTDRIWIS